MFPSLGLLVILGGAEGAQVCRLQLVIHEPEARHTSSTLLSTLAAADFTHAGQGGQPLSQHVGGGDPSRQGRGRSSAV